jgi:long-chain acyl-CoA synthetase
MLYSSGTTGRPKGIAPTLPEGDVREVMTMYQLLFQPMYGFGEDTVYLCPAPLYHAAPLRFSHVVTATGGTIVLMNSFDPQGALEAIERHRVTHSQWVPTMFVRMLKLPREVRDAYDVSSLKVAIHAAAPCPVEVKWRMIAWWGSVLYEYYAATEANGITFIGPEEWLRKPGSVGRGGLLGELRICGEDGKVLPAGRREPCTSSARNSRSGTTTTTRAPVRRSTPSTPTGRPPGTSGTSTRTATSSSPTAGPSRSSPAA